MTPPDGVSSHSIRHGCVDEMAAACVQVDHMCYATGQDLRGVSAVKCEGLGVSC